MEELFKKPYERTFVPGRHYAIYGKSNNYIFEYLRKDGIHHCFREIHGGWTQTHTDCQLIGKKVEEVL